jgi:hypothetical protein
VPDDEQHGLFGSLALFPINLCQKIVGCRLFWCEFGHSFQVGGGPAQVSVGLQQCFAQIVSRVRVPGIEFSRSLQLCQRIFQFSGFEQTVSELINQLRIVRRADTAIMAPTA